MAAVMLVGGLVVLASAVIVMRAVVSSERTGGDRNWENAMLVAEGGADDGLYVLSLDPDYATVAATADVTSRVAIIELAEELAAKDPSAVTATPEGDVVLVKRASEQVVYSVGFTPGIAEGARQARVVQITYELNPSVTTAPNWTAEHALLSGGDIELGGAARVQNAGANVHANGSLDAFYLDIDGCGAESVYSGYSAGPGCPAGPAPRQVVPIVDPIAMYPRSWFDLCPDGAAHYGPAYPDPDKANATGVPCEGDEVSSADGGNQGMNPTVTGWANSDKNTPAGVYFVVGDFDGRIGFNNDRPVTLIAAQHDLGLGCDGAGGDIWLSSQTSTVGHGSAGGITLVAAGDVVFRGGADVTGLVLAHEQIDYKGNSSLTGAVIAQDACNDPQSPLETTEVRGTADIYYIGPVTTPFDAEVPAPPGADGIIITGQHEI